MGIVRLLLLLWIVFLPAYASKKGEFSLVPMQYGNRGVEWFFDSLGFGNLHLDINCDQSGKHCWYEIVNERGAVLDRFSGETNTLTLLGKGRYPHGAYALIEREYKSGRIYEHTYFLIDNRGRKVYFPNSLFEEHVLGVKPLIDGNILIVTSGYLVEASPRGVVFRAQIPSVERVYIGNNPSGDVSMVGYAGSDLVFISYEQGEGLSIVVDYGALSTHGDRLGILSIYPETPELSYAAVYRYVNPYNKGIVFYKVDFSQGNLRKGFLFNSETRNVGFDPSVYSLEGMIVVSAKNSTENKRVFFEVPKGALAQLSMTVPEHIRGFEYEKRVEFMVSGRASTLTWNALSQVKKGSVTYAEARYDMAGSVFYGASLQGKIDETQIAITYLRNKAEEKGGITAKVSEILTAVVDFNNLLGHQSTLRIGYEQGDINGFATFRDKVRGTSQSVSFQTSLKTLSANVMMERGLFFGLEYWDYKIPSAIGFSDNSGSVVYYAFDRDFRLRSLLLNVGYDHTYYAKRYETNYRSLYFAGSGGMGLGLAEVSGYTKEDVRRRTGISKFNVPLYVVLKGYGELGYLYQMRVKSLGGLGTSFNFGYRLTFMFMGAGRDEGSSSGSNELSLEFGRYELLHGPFAQLSVIF